MSLFLPILSQLMILTDPMASWPLTPFLTHIWVPSLTLTLSLILTPTLSTVLNKNELSAPALS